jgi:hypothetical protein
VSHTRFDSSVRRKAWHTDRWSVGAKLVACRLSANNWNERNHSGLIPKNGNIDDVFKVGDVTSTLSGL